MTSHSHFKLLCALEASGQLDQCEYLELLAHCESCESCRATLLDMQSVTSQLLAVRQATVRGTLPVAMSERFVAKARHQGIHVSGSGNDGLRANRPIFAGIAAVFLLGAGCFLSKRTITSQLPAIERGEATAVIAGKTPAEHALSLPRPIGNSERFVVKRKPHHRAFTGLAPSSVGRSWPAISSSRFVLIGMPDFHQGTCCLYPASIAVSGTETWAHFPPAIQRDPSDAAARRVFRYEATLAPMPSLFQNHTINHGFTLNPGIAPPRFIPVATLHPETHGEEQ